MNDDSLTLRDKLVMVICIALGVIPLEKLCLYLTQEWKEGMIVLLRIFLCFLALGVGISIGLCLTILISLFLDWLLKYH